MNDDTKTINGTRVSANDLHACVQRLLDACLDIGEPDDLTDAEAELYEVADEIFAGSVEEAEDYFDGLPDDDVGDAEVEAAAE